MGKDCDRAAESAKREMMAEDFDDESDPLPCSTCGGPVPPTPQDPASVSARESALMAGWVPVCDKCRRIEEEND